MEKLLASASDKDTLAYEVARTWASAKQWPQTIEWLKKVADSRAGIDPSRDKLFVELRGTTEFAAIMVAVREATPAVAHSRPAFQVSEGDLLPESVAYDPKGKHFYFGSMTKGKVVRCSGSGNCTQFAGGLDAVLGLKVDGKGLWLLNNSEGESALIQYDLISGHVLRKYRVIGPGHTFNDLVIAANGDVYLTDTRAGEVWHLANGGTNLEKLAGAFRFANGIAVSPNLRLLFVSTFGDGISLVDLRTHEVRPIARPAGLCLATVDGLYFHNGSLIAVQNGFMSPRVVRLTLTRDLLGIAGFDVLERRNPLFEGITTGVVVRNDFFYMANIQDDRKNHFDPIIVLKIRLKP